MSGFQPNVLKLLDFCKGLAIVWIFLVHYKHIESGSVGWQGVHIFIVLSGFGLTYSCLKNNAEISWKQWYLRRAEKILPSYWLVALFGFIVTVYIYVFTHRPDNNALINWSLKLLCKLVLDILLLRNLFESTMSSWPNRALWFIPFIVSFYLVFPWLYTQLLKYRTAKGYILVLLLAGAIEFIYRAIAIYWLNSLPLGYNDVANADFASSIYSPPHQVPFGLFPSRMAEFVLGMLGAVILVKDPQKFNNIVLNFWVGVAGVFIWLAGNVLLYVGLWGWVFADFMIGLGLILWALNLAWAFQRRFSFFFSGLSRLGIWSYYIFLTHYIFILVFAIIKDKLIIGANPLSSLTIKVVTFGLVVVATGIASAVLMQFDKSRFAKAMVRKSIGVFLKS